MFHAISRKNLQKPHWKSSLYWSFNLAHPLMMQWFIVSIILEMFSRISSFLWATTQDQEFVLLSSHRIAITKSTPLTKAAQQLRNAVIFGAFILLNRLIIFLARLSYNGEIWTSRWDPPRRATLKLPVVSCSPRMTIRYYVIQREYKASSIFVLPVLWQE